MGCGVSQPKSDIGPYMKKKAPAGEPPLADIKAPLAHVKTKTGVGSDAAAKKELPKPKGRKLSKAKSTLASRIEGAEDAEVRRGGGGEWEA